MFALHRWPGQHVRGLFLLLEPQSVARSLSRAHLASFGWGLLCVGRGEGIVANIDDGVGVGPGEVGTTSLLLLIFEPPRDTSSTKIKMLNIPHNNFQLHFLGFDALEGLWRRKSDLNIVEAELAPVDKAVATSLPSTIPAWCLPSLVRIAVLCRRKFVRECSLFMNLLTDPTPRRQAS